jgi:restriction system protein
MTKKDELASLVALRRAETHPSHVTLSQYQNGFYDLDFVVPWTVGAQNIDAELMIVGQDWISEDYLNKNSAPEKRQKRRELGQDPNLATNKNLKRLLKDHFDLSFSHTYATNVLVFIKRGAADADVPMKDFEYCARKFTCPQIRIVKPRMVLCLGEKTFNAMRRAVDEPEMALPDAWKPQPHTKVDGAEIYGVPHTGYWGTRNAGGEQRVDEIWASLAHRFKNRC